MNRDCKLLEKLNCNCINRDRAPHHKLLCLAQQSKVAYTASDGNNGNNGKHGKKKNDRYHKSSDSRDTQSSSMPRIGYQQDSLTRYKSNSPLTTDSFAVVSPVWAPNIKIFKSPMSPKFSILGMIGHSPWIQQNSPIAKGIFHFFQQASLDNLSLLKENKYSYFVTKKATHIRSLPLQIEEIGVPFGSNYTRDDS